jgi:fibronectin-binding autotransporter adhesin
MNGTRTVTVLTNTLSVGGVISGTSYGVTKNGAGLLVLSGANTYSGATVVNAGALIVNSPGALAAGSAVTVNTGAILGGSGAIGGLVTAATNSLLAPGGLNAVGTLTLTNTSASTLTLNGATMLFDLSTVSDVGTNDQIALTGAGSKVVVSGVNRIALNLPTNGIPAGTYTLIRSMAGIVTNAGASFALLTTHPAASLMLSPTTSNLVLTITGDGIPGALWTGATSGSWDGEDQNWVTNGIPAGTYPVGAAAIFDDTATAGRFSVSSSGSVSPAALLFNNSANDYSVAAQLDGTGLLTKQGSAAVTLSGMTTYNPCTIALYDGILTFGGASQLNSGVYAGDIFNNGNLTFASSAAQTNSGIISGYGTLTKSGVGTLTLSQAPTSIVALPS